MSYLMLPPLNLDLAHRTADLLRIPHLVCRKRSCRRAGFCKWAGERTKQPYCLRNLDINQLGLFMQRYEELQAAGTRPASAGSPSEAP
jgi:hypothetical protein